MQVIWELFEIEKGLAKASSQQTSRQHPIQTTSVCKTVQRVGVLFFKKLAYVQMNKNHSVIYIQMN